MKNLRKTSNTFFFSQNIATIYSTLVYDFIGAFDFVEVLLGYVWYCGFKTWGVLENCDFKRQFIKTLF
jgi:hypothetical protein